MIATDIQDDLLKIGKEKGFVSKISKENAESLSFQDEQFDITLCREAFHHFPRPYIALYEMLRVSKECVILYEPKDVKIFNGFLSSFFEAFKQKIRFFLSLNQKGDDYEVSGNYVYTLSNREIEKLQWGSIYQQ